MLNIIQRSISYISTRFSSHLGPKTRYFSTLVPNEFWEHPIIQVGNIKVAQETNISNACELGVGCVLWNCAICLATAIDTQFHPNYFQNKSILELGSGVGLVSLTLASKNPSQVTISDQQPLQVLLEKSLSLNPSLPANKIHIKSIDWNTCDSSIFLSSPHFPTQVLICSDLLYIDANGSTSQGLERVLALFHQHSVARQQEGVVIFAFEERGELRLDCLGSFFLPLLEYFNIHRVLLSPHFTETHCALLILTCRGSGVDTDIPSLFVSREGLVIEKLEESHWNSTSKEAF